MKRSKRDYLSDDERREIVAQLRAGVQTKTIALAFNIQPRTVLLYRAGVRGMVVQSRARRQDHNAMVFKRVCIVGGCDHELHPGEKRCERHRNLLPLLSGSEFVKPLTLARLMAGR